MDKSIETIWKNGFIADEAVIAPQINDLYSKKSKNIVDKFYRMFDLNIKAIIGGILVVLPASWAFGVPFLGLFLAFLLATLVVPGRKHLKNLKKVDKNASCYQYLIAFRAWREAVIADYTKIYRYFYPLLFLGVIVQFRFSETGMRVLGKLQANFPDGYQLAGVPLFVIAIVVAVMALLTVLSGPLYRLDMKLFYGGEFIRQDDLIADMEALRKAEGSDS